MAASEAHTPNGVFCGEFIRAEWFTPRSLAAMTPTRLTVFRDPSKAARQVLAGLHPTSLGFLGGFTVH